MNKWFLCFMIALPIESPKADTVGSNFWSKCPGPACPANAPIPDKKSEERLGEEKQLIRPEKDLKRRDLSPLNGGTGIDYERGTEISRDKVDNKSR